MEFQSNLNQFNPQFDNNNYYNQPYTQPTYNTTPSYTQTTLNQFDSNLTTPSYNAYEAPSMPSYTAPSYTQTTLNDYSTPDYNINAGSGLYNSNRSYGQFSTGGNLHDTFQVDRYNNLYNTHTTVDLGKDNGNIHMGW